MSTEEEPANSNSPLPNEAQECVVPRSEETKRRGRGGRKSERGGGKRSAGTELLKGNMNGTSGSKSVSTKLQRIATMAKGMPEAARPAFNQDVQYDLSEGKTIGFKGARVEIVEATNTNIRYRVLAHFPPP